MYIAFLVALFIIGIIGQAYKVVPKDFFKKINRFIIYIPLPAIALTKIPQLHIDKQVILPILSVWIIFFVAILFFYLIGKYLKLSKATIACLVLSCGLGNTSFVGFPVLTQLYGSDSLQYAIFLDQPGSFLVMSSLGILVASYASTGIFNIQTIFRKLFTFPPFLCFLIALIIPKNFFNVSINQILEAIGSIMIPLAMLSLGLQFKLEFKNTPWRNFAIGVSYKLILAPLLIYLIYFVILGQDTYINKIAVMETAMPPMITSSIIASEYGLDEELAGVLPTLGIILSIPSLAGWYYFLG